MVKRYDFYLNRTMQNVWENMKKKPEIIPGGAEFEQIFGKDSIAGFCRDKSLPDLLFQD